MVSMYDVSQEPNYVSNITSDLAPATTGATIRLNSSLEVPEVPLDLTQTNYINEEQFKNTVDKKIEKFTMSSSLSIQLIVCLLLLILIIAFYLLNNKYNFIN